MDNYSIDFKHFISFIHFATIKIIMGRYSKKFQHFISSMHFDFKDLDWPSFDSIVLEKLLKFAYYRQYIQDSVNHYFLSHLNF